MVKKLPSKKTWKVKRNKFIYIKTSFIIEEQSYRINFIISWYKNLVVINRQIKNITVVKETNGKYHINILLM